MNELTQFLVWAQQSLMSVHWTLAVAVLALGPYAVVSAIKRLFPDVWEAIESKAPEGKSLHRISLGALVAIPTAALGVLGAGGEKTLAAVAVFSSIWSPVIYHVIKLLKDKLPPSPPRGGSGVGLVAIVLLSFTWTGCTIPLEKARTAGIQSRSSLSASAETPQMSEYCRKLDSSRTTWGALAKGSGALAGGAGISTIPLSDSREAQVAAASAAAGAAAFGLMAAYIADQKATAWARDCSAR